MDIVKQVCVIVYPYKFTNFEYFKYELGKIGFNEKIVDLSNFNVPFLQAWKSKRHKKVICPKSISELFKLFKSLKKKNVIVLNYGYQTLNFSTLLVLFLLRIYNLKTINFNLINWDLKVKKDFNWFKKKIFYHKINLRLFLFKFNQLIYKFLFKLLIFNFKSILASTTNNAKYYLNNYDYSNSLNKNQKKKKFKYALYLDNGGPYFKGDTDLMSWKLPRYNIKKIYSDYKSFFLKIERDFKCKIIVIPHPKYKSFKKKTLNPYFKSFIVDNSVDAIQKLSKNAKFILSKGSLSNAYSVTHKIPAVFFYSSDHQYEINELVNIKQMAKDLGTTAFNIKSYKKEIFKKYLKVNNMSYNKFFKKYLVTNNKFKKIQNYQLIKNYINNFN